MTSATRSRLAYLARAAAPAILAIPAIVLLIFPPEQYSFYPQCPIHHYLHILCPGCGATRALAALLHGNIAQALRLNPLTTLLTPVTVIYAAVCYRRILARTPLIWPEPPPAAIYATLVAAAVFTVARNL